MLSTLEMYLRRVVCLLNLLEKGFSQYYFITNKACVFFSSASVRHYNPETGGAEFKNTTVTMLSKEDDDFLYVEAYSQMGFRLSNGFRIVGPCVLFPRSILHWAVGDSSVYLG